MAWREPKTKLVGSFLGIPYDFRLPTSRVWRERFWNQKDPRLFTPHVFGWGWSINLYHVARWLRLQR